MLQNGHIDDIDDGIDDTDLIQLSCRGIHTEWTFPSDQSNCPVRNCGKAFDSRSDAIIHYKRTHSQKAILCELCNKPISVGACNTFIIHWQRAHPFKKMPYGLDDEGTYSLENQVKLS